jgi:hypothetical protein
MMVRKYPRFLRLYATVLIACAACPALHAQAPFASAEPEAPTLFIEPSTPVVSKPSDLTLEHRFWDKQNCALFVAAAALNTADLAVTRANLQSGGQELNPVVRMFGRTTAGLSVNFIGETVGVVSLSYFFHKTGHHKLERAVSMFNMASSAGAVSYDLMHR